MNAKIKYLIIFLLFSILLVFTIFAEEDPDLFWHLSVGKWMWQHQGILQVNPFLAVQPTGGWSHWINYQWVPQILFYRIYIAGGINALIVFKSLLWLFTFFLLFRIGFSKEKYLVGVFMMLATIFVAQARFSVRPEMFSYFFLSLYLFILYRYTIGFARMIYLLPFLQVIWVNCHLYFFLGPFIIFCFAGGMWFKEFYGKVFIKKDTASRGMGLPLKRLFLVGLFTVATCLINPNGLAGATIPLQLAPFIGSGGGFSNYIVELQPIYPRLFTEQTTILFYYKVLVAVLVLSSLANIHRVNIGSLLVGIVFMVVSLRWLRYINVFSLFAMPLISINLTEIPKLNIAVSALKNKISTSFKVFLESLIVILLLVILIASTNLFTARRILNVHELGLGASSASYPVKAVEFLKGIELEGNMFNNFESGGYIDWHLYPLKKAFIDGTIGIYGKNLWKDYLNALQGEMLPDELVQKYNIGYFLLMHRYPDSRILVKELNQKNTEWKLIYLDEVALIFVRNIPEHHGIIKRYQVIPEQIYRPILKRADKGSVRYLVYLAEVAQALGEFQEAGRLYMKALEFCPQDAELFHRLGVINYEAGLISEATVAYQKALALRPGYFGTHYSLAMCLVKNVDYIGAIAEFKECLKFNPNYAAGHYNLAVAYTMVRPCQIELAYQHLHRAVQLGFKPDPRFMEYLKKISGP